MGGWKLRESYGGLFVSVKACLIDRPGHGWNRGNMNHIYPRVVYRSSVTNTKAIKEAIKCCRATTAKQAKRLALFYIRRQVSASIVPTAKHTADSKV